MKTNNKPNPKLRPQLCASPAPLNLYQYGFEGFGTKLYIWWCSLCMQVSFVDWEKKRKVNRYAILSGKTESDAIIFVRLCASYSSTDAQYCYDKVAHLTYFNYCLGSLWSLQPSLWRRWDTWDLRMGRERGQYRDVITMPGSLAFSSIREAKEREPEIEIACSFETRSEFGHVNSISSYVDTCLCWSLSFQFSVLLHHVHTCSLLFN